MEMLHSIPETDLNRILLETNGGDYLEARTLVQNELFRRANILASLQAVDIPVWNGLE